MDLEMKGDRESLMDVGCRLTVADVRENVSCCLCRGILRRAVTINLCLHSFCRKCLLRHLRRSKVCPKCLVLIHPLTPLINIRCDYVLQRIVYKLFPDLFRREQEKQKARCLANQIAGTEASNAITKREFDESLAVFTGKETVSLCLQLQQSSSLSEEMETQEDSSVRYLQCQAAVTIGILKRFIENKLSLGSHLEVKIFYKDNLIADAYTIADVACSYGWAQVEPMLLCYTIIQLSSGLRELYTRVTEPCRNSRDGDRSSGKFSGSMASGTSSSRSNLETSVPPSFCSSGQVLLSPANTSLSLEKKIPRKRGRPPKLRNLSSMSSSSSSSPPKKRIQCQMTGIEDHPSLLPSTGILAVPETGVPVDAGGSGASQVATGVEISKQVDAAMFEEDVGSGFHRSDIVEHQVSTASSDANLSIRDSRLEGGSGCDSVELNGIPDSATPGSVPLSSPVVDPPSEGMPEITSVQVSGSETLTVPTSDQRKSGSEVSEGVVQSTQTAKNPEDCPATTKNRSFLEFAPTVHKEQNQERKGLNRDGSKEELSPTGGGKSDGNTAARSNGVSLAVDSFCPQCGRREENIEGRTSVSSRRCENCLCISTSITVFINHAQKNNNGADEYQGPFNGGSLARQGPAQVDSGPKKLSGGGTDSDDIVPKLECPDFSDGGGGGGRAQGLSRSPEKACVQQQQCRLGQPPADPRDPPRAQTKTNCRPVAAERSTPGQSNGFPSRDRVTDESSPPDAKAEEMAASWSAAAAAGERCPIGATALNGNRPVRRQKSLETIIQQLQPRQMSPVAMGNVVGPGSPRVSMATPLPTAPVRGWGAASLSSGAGLCGSGQRKEESVVGGCRRAVRSAGEGSNPRPSPQTDNRANSLLRRALTCPDPKSHRCLPSSPSKPPNATAAAATAAPSVDRLPQAPFNLLAPSIKRLRTLYEGLDASKSHRNNSIGNISAPNEENRQRIFHQRTPPVMAPMTLNSAPGVNSPGVNSAAPAAAPEAVIGRASYDVITATTMTKRFPVVVANGFDAPLELTTKESRDRKWRESSRKSGDADVLRTSFPLFGNR